MKTFNFEISGTLSLKLTIEFKDFSFEYINELKK